nr:ABC transporter ATP-binding protein [uncultured Blautia sp.]
MNNKKLICRGITKKYGKKEVLQKVDLELEPGKIYGLIGRNGAGKTTLLSIMSAQNPTTRGEVLLGDVPVWENQEALKHIYFSREINPNSTVYSGLKVKEHLKIAAAYLPNWDQELADRLVTLFHLDKKKRISKLSKGMASMLTIVTALASKAEFTFLDEPVAGLDVVAREQFYRLLVEEFTESGRTFVVSTHIIEEASDVLEEVIFLHEGEVLLKENTQELLEHCVYVSGKTEAVEEAVKGKEIHARQILGRSQGVMVRLKEEEQILPDGQITLQHMTLQKIFVSLCSGEDEAI